MCQRPCTHQAIVRHVKEPRQLNLIWSPRADKNKRTWIFSFNSATEFEELTSITNDEPVTLLTKSCIVVVWCVLCWLQFQTRLWYDLYTKMVVFTQPQLYECNRIEQYQLYVPWPYWNREIGSQRALNEPLIRSSSSSYSYECVRTFASLHLYDSICRQKHFPL